MECSLCFKNITTNFDLHFETNHKEYDCPFCDLIFSSEVSLNEHVNNSHDFICKSSKQSHTCPICNFEAPNQTQLEIHAESHLNELPVLLQNDLLNDYELALRLEAEEQENLNRDTVKAAQEAEADELNAAIYENEQFEKLRQQYGMNHTDSQTKAKLNLSWLLKKGKIDRETHRNRLKSLNNEMNSIYDNDSTRTNGAIEKLRELPNGRTIVKRYLCTACDHYASNYVDTGYGCGYRNMQMLFSAIRHDTPLKETIFNNGNERMPSILKLQELIERAWENGFDRMGREQLNGKLRHTTKWIGSSDVATLFLSLRVRAQLIDIGDLKSNKSANTLLVEYVKSYFEAHDANTGKFVYPMYIQHQGHSRTIVGIEITKTNTVNFLMFDPSTRHDQMQEFIREPNKKVFMIRKNANTFKHCQYQLLILNGAIRDDLEYENSKILSSLKIK